MSYLIRSELSSIRAVLKLNNEVAPFGCFEGLANLVVLVSEGVGVCFQNI